MTVVLPAPAASSFAGGLPVVALGPDELALVEAAVRSELGEVSVRLRHTSPFTPMRQQLRTLAADLRSVLAEDQVTVATAPSVAEVLHARADRLHSQARHCDNGAFAEQLRAEEAALLSVLDTLA